MLIKILFEPFEREKNGIEMCAFLTGFDTFYQLHHGFPTSDYFLVEICSSLRQYKTDTVMLEGGSTPNLSKLALTLGIFGFC